MTEIAKFLNKDFDVEVIGGPSFYEHKINISNSDKLRFNIIRVENFNYNKNNITSRLLGSAIISWKMYALMRKNIPNNSNVLLVSNPILLVWMCSLSVKNRKWNIKLLIHDVFPENLKSLTNLKFLTKLTYPLLKLIFDKALSKINTIISIGRDMNCIMKKKVTNCNHVIIQNWSDLKNVSYSFNNYSQVVFLYAGNFGRVQGIDKLLDAISLLENCNAKFVFIGSGASQNLIEDFIHFNKSNLVELLPWQPRENQDLFFANATIGIVSLSNGMFGLGVPSKFYNLLAAGKPIFYIGPVGSEIHLLIKEYNIGWFAEAGNVEEIIKIIKEIISTKAELLKMYSLNARNLAEKKYSKEIILNKFKQLFLNEDSN